MFINFCNFESVLSECLSTLKWHFYFINILSASTVFVFKYNFRFEVHHKCTSFSLGIRTNGITQDKSSLFI